MTAPVRGEMAAALGLSAGRSVLLIGPLIADQLAPSRRVIAVLAALGPGLTSRCADVGLRRRWRGVIP